MIRARHIAAGARIVTAGRREATVPGASAFIAQAVRAALTAANHLGCAAAAAATAAAAAPEAAVSG